MADRKPLSDAEREELIAYLDGELNQTEVQALERKISADPRIRAEAEAMRRTWNLLDFLPRPEPTPNFTHRTVDRIAPVRTSGSRISTKARRRWLQRFGWAAALLLTCLAGYGSTAWWQAQQRPDNGEAAEMDQIARDLHVIEKLGVYQNIPDINFLNELDRPELFGDD